MKFRFRVTITTILLSILVATVCGLGFSSYYNAHYNADELSKQIHDQTSARVEERLASLVSTAEEESELVSADAYVFTNYPDPSVPGVTYSTPIYDGDNALRAVLSTDFSLEALCRFIKGLSIGLEGFAFIIERDSGGVYKVIAHPDENFLINHAGHEHSLFTVDELADPRIGAFMKAIDPSQAGGPDTDFVHLRCVENGVGYVGGYRPLLAGTHPPHWLICTIVPEKEIMWRVHRNNLVTLGVATSSFLLMILISSWVSRQVARPLEQLDEETKTIRNFRLEPHEVAHSFVLEVDRLATHVEEMKTGLRSFRKFVPVDLVRSMLSSGQEAALGGERRILTVYFSDIADFTAICERLAPETLVEVLGEFLSAQSCEILRQGGTIDKFIGDSIMAFWGAPAPNARHALAACTAAVRNQQKMEELHRKWRAEQKPLLVNRIGINSGEVIVGNIGYEERMNYTVIGDSVNLASRLEGLNKVYGTRTIIAEATYFEVRQAVVARPLDKVLVKGKTEPIVVYDLLGLKGEVEENVLEPTVTFSRALEHYWRQDWAGAMTVFQEVLRIHTEDRAGRLMVDRCVAYQQHPPHSDWNGVHLLTSK